MHTGCWSGSAEQFCLQAARKGSAVWVEPAAEVCHWSEWFAFDGLAARKGSAVLTEPVAAEHRPASEWYGSGWQAAAVFE